MKIIFCCIVSTSVVAACFWNVQFAAAQRLTNFPGPHSVTTSPDGKYTLRNEDSAAMDPPHRLLLKKKSDKDFLPLLSYNRHVTVLWSPDSRHVAVVDAESSDSTNSLIFPLSALDHPVDLRAELNSKLQDNGSVFQNHHVYIEAVRWMNPSTIRLKIWGYGDKDPKGFTLWLDYKLSGEFKRVRIGKAL